MDKWTIRSEVELQAPERLSPFGGQVTAIRGDSDSHQWLIEVTNGGEPADLDGASAVGHFVRPDGNDVIQAGTIVGHTVTVVIPQTALAYPGEVRATVRIVSGEQVEAIAVATLAVEETVSGETIDPGNVVNVDEIAAMYEDMAAAVEAAQQYIGLIAPLYSATKTYAIGDYVTYSGKVYRCTTAITTAEAWTSGHWTETSAGDEVKKAVMAGATTIGSYAALTALTGDGTLGNLPVNRIYYIGGSVASTSQEIADAPCPWFYGTVCTFAQSMTSHSGAVQVAVMPQASSSSPVYDVTNVYVRYGASSSWSEWKMLLNGEAMETVKRYWEGTPFELIEYEKYERAKMPSWNTDTSTPPVFTKRGILNGTTRLHKCPRYIGWFLNSSAARMYIYIGTLDGNGDFTPDIQITRASSSLTNNISSGYNQIIDVGDTNHYFYYSKSADPDNVTIIGADEWPQSDTDGLAVTPYGRGSYDSTTQTYGVSFATSNNGIMLPAGCAFAVLPPSRIVSANQGTCAIRACVGAEGIDRWRNLAAVEIVPFGRIPDGLPGLLSALPGTNTEQCRVYIHKEVNDRASGYVEQAHELAKKLNEIAWECAGERDMRHADVPTFSTSATYTVGTLVRYEYAIYRCTTAVTTAGNWNSSYWTKVSTIYKYVTGKRYHGIPYSGGWGDTHWVGYEISPFTMVSAAADEYSIFYDTTEGRSAIPANDGPGMGLVCSTFGALALGCPYPQTNRGYTWDDNFVCVPETKAVAGGLYTSGNHVVYVDEVLRDGPVTYEEHAVGTGKYFYNAGGGSDAMAEFTQRTRMHDYIYRAMPGWYKANGYDGFYADTTNLTPVNGTVRPWRGNKSVCGPYDITKYGGIYVTIHATAGGTAPTTIKLVKPGTQAVTDITIPSGATVVDITSAVTADGTYTLYSDADSTNKEYFRYWSHDPVTFAFDENKRCVFSAADVDYCYGRGTGHSIPAMDDNKTAFIVYAKGVGYKRLFDAEKFNSGCSAAMVRDPGDANDPTGDTGSWGRYSVACSYSGYIDDWQSEPVTGTVIDEG